MAKVELLFGASPTPDIMEALRVGGRINIPAVLVGFGGDRLPSTVRTVRKRLRQRAVPVLVKISALTMFIFSLSRVLHAQNFARCAHRRGRHLRRRRFDLLRLCRLRRGFHRRRGNPQPPAQCPLALAPRKWPSARCSIFWRQAARSKLFARLRHGRKPAKAAARLGLASARRRCVFSARVPSSPWSTRKASRCACCSIGWPALGRLVVADWPRVLALARCWT